MSIFSKLINKNNNENREGQIEWVSIDKLKFDSVFKSTYEQKPEKVALLCESMKDGFNPNFPITVTEDYRIVDGSSRYTAACKIGLKSVPVIVTKFSSDEEAVKWQHDTQNSSRQYSDYEILSEFMYYENLREKAIQEKENISCYTNESLASCLNVSERMISKFRRIYSSANRDEILNKIKNNELNIAQAEKLLAQKEVNGDTKQVRINKDFNLGIKHVCNQIALGKKISEILAEVNLSEILDGNKITLAESDLEKIKKILSA